MSGTDQEAHASMLFGPEVVDRAYGYLMSRLLVVRQEIADLAEQGVDYNVIKHNEVGSADFVNPNLDVAYLEAWIAVDHATPAILTVPKVTGRYYTAQLLDEWGDVVVNINERTFPDTPHGDFAIVAPGATASAPEAEGMPVIELPSLKAKMLARVELRDDVDGAARLAMQFRLRSTGTPEIAPPVPVPAFPNDTLLDVTAFELAPALLDSAPDPAPAGAALAATVREIAGYVASSPEARAEIDEIIRTHCVPGFLRFAVTQSGKFQNGWLGTLTVGDYGDEVMIRSAANLVGIWANSATEVIYFVSARDAYGQPFDGSRSYRMHFAPDQVPQAVVDSYWSIILVGLPDYRVIPNPDDRFNLNTYSPLVVGDDGSLELLFSPDRPVDHTAANWLPTPVDRPFSLTLRTYVPKDIVRAGGWFPPAATPCGTESR